MKEELIANKESEELQYNYHLQVLKNIDSALKYQDFRRQFIDSGKISLSVIAPEGVLRRDLDDIAWQVAKQNNILSKTDLKTYSLLTEIYDQQQRITKSEDETPIYCEYNGVYSLGDTLKVEKCFTNLSNSSS